MTRHDLEEDHEQRLAEEELIWRTQSIIQRELNKQGLKHRDLARRLGVSVARISQLMGDDPRNLTVRTVARILYHLGESGEFMTNRDVEEMKGNETETGGATWVFTAPVCHFYGGEGTEVIFEATSFKESTDDSQEWAKAEAAAAGRMRMP
jgi:transcriptional regulator with XRE-family HTH domain